MEWETWDRLSVPDLDAGQPAERLRALQAKELSEAQAEEWPSGGPEAAWAVLRAAPGLPNELWVRVVR
jgi:hypothetical protein